MDTGQAQHQELGSVVIIVEFKRSEATTLGAKTSPLLPAMHHTISPSCSAHHHCDDADIIERCLCRDTWRNGKEFVSRQAHHLITPSGELDRLRLTLVYFT